MFQSTLLQRSDPVIPLFSRLLERFNPRSCKGATIDSTSFMSIRYVSIHAPAKERPASCGMVRHSCLRFNPRSCKGATYRLLLFYINTRRFNPRSCKGATFLLSCLPSNCCVSIHAPAKERLIPFYTHIIPSMFQSTLLQRSDAATPVGLRQHGLFQSTLLQRSDLYVVYVSCTDGCFNPRSCKGATFVLINRPCVITCFNPRSCKGATYFLQC